jgi:hypothetical protein
MSSCAANSKSDHSKLVSRSRSLLRSPEKRQAGTYSTDGTCGPANGNTLCDPNSTAYTGSCCSQYGWVSPNSAGQEDFANSASAETLQPTVGLAAFLAATTVLRRRPRTHLLLPGELRLGMMVDAAKTSVTPRAMPTVPTADAALSTGRFIALSPLLHLLTNLIVTVVLPMVTASSPTAAKMAARTPPLLPQHPLLPLRPPVPHPSLALVSPSLVSPRPLPPQSRPAFRLSMAAVVQRSATPFAVTGRKGLAAPCTDTVVTPLLTAVRDARTALVPRLLARLLLRQAPLLQLPDLELSRSRVDQVFPPCTPV